LQRGLSAGQRRPPRWPGARDGHLPRPDGGRRDAQAADRGERTALADARPSGREFPFEVWRLSASPPEGWRAIGAGDIDCTRFDAPVDAITVAMLGIAVPAEGGPSERALAINISELQNRSEAQKILYTHANNRISAGSPVFDLTTGDVFAIHVGSEPDPGAPGRRRGYGYSLRHLLDMVRASIRGAKLGPVCPD